MSADGYKVSFWDYENVQGLVVMIDGLMNILKTTEFYTLKW